MKIETFGSIGKAIFCNSMKKCDNFSFCLDIQIDLMDFILLFFWSWKFNIISRNTVASHHTDAIFKNLLRKKDFHLVI